MPKARTAKKNATRSAAERPAKATSKPVAKKAKPVAEAVDESSWPASTVPLGRKVCRAFRALVSTLKPAKVNKTKAKELYRVKDEELASVGSERVEYVMPHYDTGKVLIRSRIVKTINGQRIVKPMILYRERDVEHIAWRKHGGRDAFYDSLDKLKARYDKAQAKEGAQPKPFHAPESYLNSRGLQAHGVAAALIKARRPQTLDEEWTGTRELLGLKARFTPWVWNAVIGCAGKRELRHWGATREEIVKIALNQLDYPERPREILPPSVSLNKLRDVLAGAPRKGESDYGEYPGIVNEDDHEGEPSWRWSDDYTKEVYSALIDVVGSMALVTWVGARLDGKCFKSTLIALREFNSPDMDAAWGGMTMRNVGCVGIQRKASMKPR